jgi:N-acylneuraminate cytidylyltransferase
MNFAIIPARGGSKRIPRKNVKDFLGEPILRRTIHRAIESGLFDEIFVSTEDEEISRVSLEAGAKVISRPRDLSDDYTTTREVIVNAIRVLASVRETDGSIITCIYPVTPLLHYSKVAQALKIAKDLTDGFVIAGIPFGAIPERGFYTDDKGSILVGNLENMDRRSQDFKEMYQDAGQFYSARCNVWTSDTHLFSTKSRIVKMKKYEVIDIDQQEEWDLAEQIFKFRSTS